MSQSNPPSFAALLPPALRAWYLTARPRSLPATYAPLFVGGAVTVATGTFHLGRFVLALIGALFLQIASNFINEYVDFRRGTDAKKVDGMGMTLTKGQLTAPQVLIGAVACVVVGSLIGLYLVTQSGLTLLWIGVVGVLVVILYTAGPLPLSYLGMGEITVFIAMGPLMVYGTFYAVSGGIENWPVLLVGVPLAFPVAAILHANNMRDLESDKQAGKMTLAVRFGMEGARLEYRILIYGGYVATACLILLNIVPWHTILMIATLPEAYRLVQFATTTDHPKDLHVAQGRTAQLHWHIGLALTVGWLAYALVIWAQRQ